MSALTEPITGDGGAIYHPDTDDEQSGDGTLATTGTSVTGSSTTFQTKFPNFATTQPTFLTVSLPDGSVESRLVTAVASETGITLGTAFSEDLAALTAWTYFECNKVPFVINASGTSASRAEVDASHLGVGTYDVSVPGSINPGTMNFPVHFVGANAELIELETRFNSGLTVPWILFRKDATTPVAVPSLNNGRLYFRGWLMEAPYAQARNETNKTEYVIKAVGKRIFEIGT